jgi:transposase
MPREYRHIQEYEKEILELLSKGMTQREVGEKLGFSKKQIKNFMARYHQKERKIAAGMAKERQTLQRYTYFRDGQAYRTSLPTCQKGSKDKTA